MPALPKDYQLLDEIGRYALLRKGDIDRSYANPSNRSLNQCLIVPRSWVERTNQTEALESEHRLRPCACLVLPWTSLKRGIWIDCKLFVIMPTKLCFVVAHWMNYICCQLSIPHILFPRSPLDFGPHKSTSRRSSLRETGGS
jgi:hypothetical protein